MINLHMIFHLIGNYFMHLKKKKIEIIGVKISINNNSNDIIFNDYVLYYNQLIYIEYLNENNNLYLYNTHNKVNRKCILKINLQNNKNDLMKILNINYTKLLKHFHLIIGLNNNKNINKNKCTKNNKCQFLNRHTLRNNNNN